MAPEYVDYLNRSEGRSMPRPRKLGRNSRGIVRKSGPNSTTVFRSIDGNPWSTRNLVAYRYRVAILTFSAIALITTGIVQWYVTSK